MSRYIALTLGPITRVISLAKTTRGMWAASYLFSYLAKQIIKPFKDRKPFLLPFLDSNIFSDNYKGAGVFPDRYIFQSEEGDFDKLAATIENVVGELAQRIAPKDSVSAKTMLMQYLKFYFFQTDREEGDSDLDLVKRCEDQLALLEQHDSFIPSIPPNKHYLSSFLNSETLAPMRFMLDDAGIKERFKSIVNITTGNDGLGYTVDTSALKPYECYIAIVSADGDSMGKAFAKADNSNELSRKLFNFNVKAIDAIDQYGGQPVFIGGDDLFFFAPVYNLGKGSIFRLLNQLDDSFHSELGENSPATLSFGVSITFYKYPMYEAVKLSQQLLDKAKGKVGSIPVEKPLKNNILFAIQKHSGQTRSALLHKGCTETVERMNELIDKYIVSGDKDDLLLVSSVMHNLREHEPVLLNAIGDKKLLENYFKNNYNEPVHDKFKDFFSDVCVFLQTAYVELAGKTDQLKNALKSFVEGRSAGFDPAYAAIDLCYTTLQFIHQVNSKKK